MALLSLQNITAGYGRHMILKDFNLDVEQGEFLSLLGSSGCGKTTTLRLAAGFQHAQAGKILLNGQDITRVPVHRRGFGFVFQSYALFPHMTVYDNVAFGLKMRGVHSGDIRKKVTAMLETVDLRGFEKRLPREMSGGQRQRVALARAMVIEPALMLFDEPLSNLDAKLRVKMRVEIRRIQQQLGFTAIYVTHDQEECFAISDQVAVMNNGVIEQLGSPDHIYRRPQTAFVANFVGFQNFVPVTARADGYILSDGTALDVEHRVDGAKLAAIRPEHIELMPEPRAGHNHVAGVVRVATFLGQSMQYNVQTAVGEFVVKTEKQFPVGQAVTLLLNMDKIILLQDMVKENIP